MHIRLLFDHGEVRDFLRDNGYPEEIPEWFPAVHFFGFTVGVYQDGELVAVYPLTIIEGVLSINVCIKPEWRGEYAGKASRAVIRWIFKNTGYSSIYANITLPHVERHALACGFKRLSENTYEVTHGKRS